MTRTLSISDTGLRLIKAFEGFRPNDTELANGIRVVGYGHRLEDNEENVQWTRADAQEQLLYDLEPIEEVVNDEVHAPLSQSQFDALCSFAFNVGLDVFRRSDIVRAINNGRPLDAANGFDVWRKATINGQTYVVDALMRRRTAEKALFLRNDPFVPAPSALLTPEVDVLAPTRSTDDSLPRYSEAATVGIVPDALIDVDDGALTADLDVSDDTAADIVAGPLVDTLDPALIVDDSAEDLSEDDAAIVGFFTESDTDESPILTEDDLDPADTYDVQTTEDTTPADPADMTDETPYELKVEDELDTDAEDALSVADAEREVDDEIDADTDVSTETDMSEEDEDANDNESDDTPPTSALAAAADSLGDRLSALLDSDDTTEDTPSADWPTSLLKPSENEEEESPRSNLVSFPKRERVMETVAEDEPADVTVDQDAVIQDQADNVLVIDNLDADDVIRASQDPDAPVFDPDGDPVENAKRYLERKAETEDEHNSGGGLWIPLALGGLLIGASGVLLGRGATEMLNAWGPTAVTASAITGGLLILFTIYTAARGRFA